MKRVLPKYSNSLPIAYFLLLGTVFLGEILILHTSFAYSYGKQRAFLWYTLVALMLGFLIAVGTVFGTHSLPAVAVGEVVALGLWWLLNEWKLREITEQTLKDWCRALALFCWAVISYWVASRQAQAPLARMTLYYGLIAGAV